MDSLATIPGSLEGLEADWGGSAAQKIKKLSESPTTVPIVAKLCMIDCKNRKNAKKLVQNTPENITGFFFGVLHWIVVPSLSCIELHHRDNFE